MFTRAVQPSGHRRARLSFAVALTVALVAGFLPLAPLSPAFAANPAANIDQCANGGVGDPDEQCTGANWVNGNLGASKAHYAEGESVPYRLRFTDLATSGAHNVIIEWDTTKGGKHALDYLTTYNRTEGDAQPCELPGCNPASFSTWPIPVDTGMTSQSDWGAAATQVSGLFTMFGGTITGVSGYTFSGSWSGDSSTRIAITFTASVANPVLAWAGHIASRADWGVANSAVAISGSPFHMRLIDLDGSGGNQDRSLSNEAVIFPGSITVVKQAAPEGPTSFGFTSTGGSLPGSFSLVDDGSASNTLAVTGIMTFGTHTVTEAATPGWTLTSLSCTDPTGGTTTSGRTATIVMAEGDNVVCTFGNTRNASITVVKTATPESLPEPGGPVTFNVSVTNDSPALAVTITSLNDSVFGNVAVAGGSVLSTTCALPHTIAAAGSWSCSFQGTVTGDAGFVHTDTVTATGTDALGNPVSDSDDATVNVTDVGPAIVVDKQASPTTVTEPGGSVTFTVTITNPVNAVEAIHLDSLTDNVYGDLDGKGTCDVSPAVTIAPGTSYGCSFTETVTGNAGSIHTDVVTGTAHDNEGTNVSDSDDASVMVTDVAPAIVVDKAAAPSTVPEPGGPVTFTVTVTNPAAAIEAIYLDSLVDSVFGNLDGQGTCDVSPPVTLAPGATYSCTFTKPVAGNAGFVHTNVVTGTAHDDDNNDVSDTGTASVTVTDVVPSVLVDKSASPTTVAEPGGLVTFTVTVTNPANAVEEIYLDSLDDSVFGDLDGEGTCDVSPAVTIAIGDHYSCSFTQPVNGNAGFVHMNVVTGTVHDDDENEVSDTGTATVTVTDMLPSILVGKAASPITVAEPGGPVTFTVTVTNPAGAVEAVYLDSLVDSQFGNLDGRGTCDVSPAVSLAPGAIYICTFIETVNGDAGFVHTNVVTGTAHDDDENEVSDTGTARVTVTDVLPSIVVDKAAAPSTVPEPGAAVTFTVTVTNPANAFEAVFLDALIDNVYGDLDGMGTCDVSPPVRIAIGGNYSCSFDQPVSGDAGSLHTDVVTGTAHDNESNQTSDSDDATVTVSDVEPSIVVDKAAAPTTVTEPGGPVTFTVTVTNPADAVEAIYLDSLVDDVYGDLDGSGTCDVSPPVSLAPAASYTCSFTETVTGDAGSVHKDVITGTAHDNENNDTSDSDDATVTVTDVRPVVVVDKSAAPSSVPEPGAPVTFTVTVSNPQGAAEPIQLTSLVDDIYGNLDGAGTCDVTPAVSLAPGASYTCSFTEAVTGDAGSVHTDVVTGTAYDNDENEASDTGTASVTVTDVKPTVAVDKAAAPTTVPEPGGQVTFTVTVTNPENAVEAIFLDALVDDIYGNLDGVGSCDVTPAVKLPPTARYTCSFTKTVSGDAGTVHTDVVTGTAHDNEDNDVSDTGTASVRVTDVLPAIAIDKTADATVVLIGQSVTYIYRVTNPGVEPLDVTVTDDKCGPVTRTGGDTDGDNRLDVNETWIYSCTATLTVTTVNTAIATGQDNEGNTVTATDTARVEVRILHPAITIDKVADPSSISVSGPVTYTYVVTNTGDTALFNVIVTDDILGTIGIVGTLEPGESITMAKTVQVDASTPPTNIGVVTGTDILGQKVTAIDSATITVVLAEVVELPRTGAPLQAQARAALLLAEVGVFLHLSSRRRRRGARRAD